MRWQSGRRSSNVEDRRGRKIPRGAKGGGIGILLLALVGMYFGIDPALIMNLAGGVSQETSTATTSVQQTAEEK